MAKKNPWYPMYASDWLQDTAPWPIEADGLLIRMLNYQQIEGGLPNDWRMIGKLLRVPSRKAKRIFSTYLQPKFDLIDDKWVNRRLAEVMQEQETKRLKLSNAGIKGNEVRWPKVSGGDSPSDTGGNRILESELELDKERKRESARVPETESEIMKRIEAKIDPMEKEAVAVCGDIETYLKSVKIVLVNPFHSTSPIRQCLESGITRKQIGAVYRMIFEDMAPSKDTLFHKGKLGSVRFGFHLKDKWGELYAKVEGTVNDNQSALLEARYGK